MGIEKLTIELDGLTGQYRLIVTGDYDTLWVLREELVGRMLAQHGWRRKRALVPEEARTNPELVAVIVARLWESEGRPLDSWRVRRELRKIDREAASRCAAIYLKRAEKAGLIRQVGEGWVPAEGLAARFAGDFEGLQLHGETTADVAADVRNTELLAEPNGGK